MNKYLMIVFLVFLLFPSFHVKASDNPFVSKKEAKEQIKLPTVASQVFAQIMLWQQRLNTKLTEQVKILKTDKSLKTLFPLMLISFLYGVIHAAGPGHGKVVVFSYFISRRSDVKKGVFLGNLISLFHAVSGIVIVLTLYFIIKTSYLSSFEVISQKIKLISYSLIVLIGLLLLLNSIFNITSKLNRNSGGNAPSAESPTGKGVLALALAVGMVPCPGVVIIMLFALSFNLLAIGLTMSLLMALGMATTITLAGLISIVSRGGLLRSLSRKERAQQFVQKGLTVFGSLLIITFGGMLLAGTL